MFDLVTLVALFGVGLVAGFVDAVAGGDSESARFYSADRQKASHR